MGAEAGGSFHRQPDAPFAIADLVEEGARAFVSSMPPRYREVFDPAAAAAHAAIVARRGDTRVHVEPWKELPDGSTCVCVVAEDGPGLLALLSAAFIANEIDVVAAQVFCRTLEGGAIEAVDFFWLRRADAPTTRRGAIDRDEVAEVRDRLLALWGSRPTDESIAIADRVARRPLAPTALTSVSFDASRDGGFILTVQTHDRPGLLLAIARTLFRAGLRISRSEVRTKSGVVCDQFHLLDADGSPVGEEMRSRVQAEVHAAIAALASAQAPAK